jgi:hypothetical protein
MSDEPYTEEDEKLAESLVDEAMTRFRPLLTEEQQDEIREYLVDMLLATKSGRRKLALVKVFVGDHSDQVDRFGNPILPEKKESGTG